MNRSKFWNRVRNGACVILIITALLLTYQIFSVIMGTSGMELLKTALGYQEEEQFYPGYEEQSWALELLTPLSCAVRSEQNGALYGTPDRENASVWFEKISPILIEALETAQTAQNASEALWQTILSDTMFSMDFGGQIHLAILAQLLGTEGADVLNDSAQYTVLAVYQGSVCLFYRDAENTPKYMKTSAETAYFDAICREAVPNGYCFAYEKALTEADTMIIMPPATVYPEMTAVNLLETTAEGEWNHLLENVLEGFNINGYIAGAYREGDGTLVYVDEERTLRVSRDGWFSFYNPKAAENLSYEQDIVGQTAQIAESARIMAAFEQSFAGEAALYLIDASYEDASGQYVVRFGAEIDGIRILNDTAVIAELRFQGGDLAAARIFFQTFRSTGQMISVLPALQAVAAADSLTDFGLYYRLCDNQVLLGWYAA